MSAQNPAGGQKYWINGVPFKGFQIGSRDTGTVKYWFNGAPAQVNYPAYVAPPPPSKNNGKSGDAPGHNKPNAQVSYSLFLERLMRSKARKSGWRYVPEIAVVSDSYVPCGSEKPRGLIEKRTIQIGTSSHTVKG